MVKDPVTRLDVRIGPILHAAFSSIDEVIEASYKLALKLPKNHEKSKMVFFQGQCVNLLNIAFGTLKYFEEWGLHTKGLSCLSM